MAERAKSRQPYGREEGKKKNEVRRCRTIRPKGGKNREEGAASDVETNAFEKKEREKGRGMKLQVELVE